MASGEVARQEDFDYVRIMWVNMHGIPVGRSFPTRHLDQVLEDGVRAYAGILGLGPRTEVVMHPDLPTQGNLVAWPLPATLHPLPWAADPNTRVGQMLANCYWQTGEPHGACTRSLAQRQLDLLEQEFQLRLKSAFEWEFMVLDGKTKEGVFEGRDAFTTLVLAEFEGFLYGMERKLKEAGVDMEGISIEYASGQFEMASSPELGMAGADKAVIFKSGVKEMSAKAGYLATFMTKPCPDSSANACHLNHSLWDAEGRNACHDPEDPDKLSPTFRHWLAGLVKHGPALTALCSPTTNCYRRMHTTWCPDKADWGIDNRITTFRVKNFSPRCTYAESRLPSAAANPYLAVAGTVAAGMDGLRNKLELPPQQDPEAVLLPSDLEGALEALEKDEVLKEALGELFIRWFTTEKRTVELEMVKACEKTEDALEAERYMYEKFI